ncbi:unnamed protein product [Durusdinium trenchii]|uniref:Uncharacterized protein n=1 Tax=Durusdinium trenchii TaxID=1381693 RepID=A0ABP0KW68_9DINO
MACHGDDIIAEGTAADLDRLDEIMKRRFEVKVLPRIDDPSYGGAVAEGKRLNRIIQWSDKGFSWQADPKHAVELVRELGLEGSKGVETPASKDAGRNERHADDPLSSSDAREAEYYALTRGSSAGLVVKRALQEVQRGTAQTCLTDSTACKGIAHRRGVGKVKHLSLKELWLQDAVEKGELKVKKEKTSENWADLGTKILDAPRVAELMSKMPLFRRGLVGVAAISSQTEKIEMEEGFFAVDPPSHAAGRLEKISEESEVVEFRKFQGCQPNRSSIDRTWIRCAVKMAHQDGIGLEWSLDQIGCFLQQQLDVVA